MLPQSSVPNSFDTPTKAGEKHRQIDSIDPKREINTNNGGSKQRP